MRVFNRPGTSQGLRRVYKYAHFCDYYRNNFLFCMSFGDTGESDTDEIGIAEMVYLLPFHPDYWNFCFHIFGWIFEQLSQFCCVIKLDSS